MVAMIRLLDAGRGGIKAACEQTHVDAPVRHTYQLRHNCFDIGALSGADVPGTQHWYHYRWMLSIRFIPGHLIA